jgi:hypothetical protein
VENTVWKQLQPVDGDVDYDQLEDEFAAKQAKMRATGSDIQAPKHRLLLTMQRAQNVGVMLAKLKRTPAQVGSCQMLCTPAQPLPTTVFAKWPISTVQIKGGDDSGWPGCDAD